MREVIDGGLGRFASRVRWQRKLASRVRVPGWPNNNQLWENHPQQLRRAGSGGIRRPKGVVSLIASAYQATTTTTSERAVWTKPTSRADQTATPHGVGYDQGYSHDCINAYLLNESA